MWIFVRINFMGHLRKTPSESKNVLITSIKREKNIRDQTLIKQIKNVNRMMTEKQKIKCNYLLQQKNILKPRRVSALSKKVFFFLFMLFLFSVNFFILFYIAVDVVEVLFEILLFWNKKRKSRQYIFLLF